jgi:ribose 5-phosphate isomerase B
MKILLASDHAGFKMKEEIKAFLNAENFDVEDLGAHVFVEDDDYPEIMLPVAMRIVNDPVGTKAVIFGKSGNGEAMICNRLPGVRAAVYHGGNLEIVRLSRMHNDANILSIGAGFMEDEEAKKAVRLWLSTPFSNEERHIRRIEKLDAIE